MKRKLVKKLNLVTNCDFTNRIAGGWPRVRVETSFTLLVLLAVWFVAAGKDVR